MQPLSLFDVKTPHTLTVLGLFELIRQVFWLKTTECDRCWFERIRKRGGILFVDRELLRVFNVGILYRISFALISAISFDDHFD